MPVYGICERYRNASGCGIAERMTFGVRAPPQAALRAGVGSVALGQRVHSQALLDELREVGNRGEVGDLQCHLLLVITLPTEPRARVG